MPMNTIANAQPYILIGQMERTMDAAEQYVLRCKGVDINHDAMLAHIHQQLGLIRALNECLKRADFESQREPLLKQLQDSVRRIDEDYEQI